MSARTTGLSANTATARLNMPDTATTVRLILGDQLNASHSWFRRVNSDCVYLIAELKQETEYVQHHVQKLVAFFTAMANFAQALTAAGHRVEHLTLDESAKFADLPALITATLSAYGASRFEYMQPDEYRLSEQLQHLALPNSVASVCVDSEHFYLPHEEIAKYFAPKQAKQMEAFYRKIRKRFNVLMVDGEPEGQRWNFDQENRNKLSKEDLSHIPSPKTFAAPTAAILARLQRHHISFFGHIDEQLVWPTNRREAIALLEHFCAHCLPLFGRFQDAMTANNPHAWSLYHSRLSFALNVKLISPQRVVERAIAEYRQRPTAIDLAQIEGFVRQIIGWREFMRGMYWANMPEYATLNALENTKPLPEFYWTGQTHMRCLQQSISQSLDYAYAHHIQRLMITGNFALLIGAHPDAVDAWYLGIYIDALEWVEMPNTRGMSQYADGGLVASKPYIASGAYINKMSDYCGQCHYQVKAKTGDKSCPFNSLYWHFLQRHKKMLGRNHRLSMVYRNLERMDSKSQAALSAQAELYLANLDKL